jgi:uncharacterized membrane protein
MSPIDQRTSRSTTLSVLVTFALTIMTSIKARGLQRTLVFVALGVILPVLGEYVAINKRHILRHHLQPQAKGVPFAIALSWYIIGYNVFTMVESLAVQLSIPAQRRRMLLPLGTAVTATSFDLLTDVALLEQGYWEWSTNGAYASNVVGPNGKHGIPVENYTGWLLLTSVVTALYLLVSKESQKTHQHPGAAGSVAAGRNAALLLLPTYLSALQWEVRQRRMRYICYALLFPIVLVLALWGKPLHNHASKVE